MQFGDDGLLYATARTTTTSLDTTLIRFNGVNGAHVDSFNIGRDSWSFQVGADGLVYLSGNGFGNMIDRLGGSSLAAFTVSLSAPSATPVTVDYQTIDGSAIAGDDYVAASGTLTFAPGQTSRTILVPTVDNGALESSEMFTVLLESAVGATIADDQGAGTIYDDETAPTKFYVVDDASQNRTFEYNVTGGLVENYNVNSGNSAPRGVASSLAGDKTWVVDANRKVYVYNTNGGLLGSWTAGTLANNATPEGVATNGTDVWIVDGRSDKVYRYAGAAGLATANPAAASSFSLASGNTNPKDIVTDGQSLWVVNDGPKTDKVFKYTLSGISLGSWTIDSANKAPTGITIDPANVGDVWIVDSGTDRVYQYAGAAFRTSLSQAYSASFALAPGNTNPQGIADPPASSELNAAAALAPPAHLTSDLALASHDGPAWRPSFRSSWRGPGEAARIAPRPYWAAIAPANLGTTEARSLAPAQRPSFDVIERDVIEVDSIFAELASTGTWDL
jgi:hypothetical protein